MPFKIIQTKERGKFILTIIPDKWEQNRILHWPKRRVEDLLEQESSCPDDSWLTMKCQVKRTGLISKQSAEAELANMLQESDTETEGSTPLTSNAKLINVAQHNFDEIASACETDKPFEAPFEEESINNEQTNSVVYEYITDIPQTSEQNVTLQVQNENSQNTEAISNIFEITGALQQNQQIILDYIKSMEDKILRKLSFLSAQVDTIAERNVMAGKKAENVAFKIISNKEDLHNFEKLLENPKYRSDIKNQLSCVCGKGKGRGISNAYSLADAMFTRHFMTQCSWGGGSKKEISKLCFKSYTNTVELFFCVIHESDADYTKKENETFFKNIMRHSVSRNKQNIQRAASSRRRSQKQSKLPTALLAPTANNNGSSTITTNNIVASNQPSPTVDNNISSTNNTNSIVATTQPASTTDSNGSSTDPISSIFAFIQPASKTENKGSSTNHTSSIVASTQPTAPSEDNNSFITNNNKTTSTVQPSLSAVPAVL